MKFNWKKSVRTGILTFALAFFSSTQFSFSQTLATVGTDFWLGFMHNTGSSGEELRLFISSQSAATGTVEIPLMGWSTSFTVAPNVTTTVIVPLALGETITSDQIDTRGIHVTTTAPVSLFGINFSVFSADASKILPALSLGTEYVVSAYRGITGFTRSEMLIVSTQDNTEIEIIPSVATEGGHPAGTAYSITLDEGETYQVRSNLTTTDLTGTIVRGTLQSGTCRPFAVFGGTQCANVPTTCTTCDHLFDQQFPAYAWGTEYYVPPFQSTGTYTYRVLARDNGTLVSVNGAAPQNLNAGQFIEVNNETFPRQITSNFPVQVVQFMQGDNCSLNGDPAMLILNANDQQIEDVTFSTVSSNVITSHFLNIIVASSNIGTVLLDNNPIPAGSFNTFASNPTVSYAQVAVTQGSHNLYAANGFTAYAYGMGNAESYAYSLGSYKEETVLPVDSILCTTSAVNLVPPINLFSPEWYAMSSPTTILGTSNSLALTPPIVTDVYVIDGVSPLSGCPESFSFSVSGGNPPSISINVSEDTVCIFSPVLANVVVTTPGFYQYEWWPLYAFDQPYNDSSQFTPTVSGWYGVTVSNVGAGCTETSDSVYIEVLPGSVQSVSIATTDTLLCLPNSATLSATVNEILFFEEFTSAPTPSTWSTILGATPLPTCGSISGDALFFAGGPLRRAVTNDFNVSTGGELQFYLMVANGTLPCDDAEFGENVILEYSTNGGATWVLWTTLFEFNYPTATLVTLPIPVGAQTASTRFRWSQPTFTAVNEDVWWLDNILLTAIGGSGLAYSWSPSNTLSQPNAPVTAASPTNAGWYVLNVGTGNCAFTDSVYIDISEPFTLAPFTDTILCGNQSVTLDAQVTGGGSNLIYTWGPPNGYSSILGASATTLPNTNGVFEVTVDSPDGCYSQTASSTIVNHNLTPTITGNTVICLGQSTTLTANITGANTTYSISWFAGTTNLNTSQTSIVVSPTSTTVYTLVVEDLQGACSWSATIPVTVSQFTVNAGPDVTLCEVAGYQLQGSALTNNPQYSWSSPSVLSNANIANPTILQNGTYTFTLTVTNNGCSYSDVVQVTYNAPIIQYLPEDTLICEGGTINLNYGNATNMIWSPMTGVVINGTSIQITPTSSLNYTVFYQSSNGCTVYDTMEVTYQNLPQVQLPSDVTLCPGNTLTLQPITFPFGGNLQWGSGATTPQLVVSSAGTYTVNYSNVCGTATDAITVDYFAPFSVDLGNDTVVCTGEQVSLNPVIPAGGSVVWSNGSTQMPFIATSPSSVGITVDDGNGCLQQDAIQITNFPTIQTNLPSLVSVCVGESVVVDAFSPQAVAYDWNSGETTSAINITNPGIYTVIITDANNCSIVESVQMNQFSAVAPVILGPTDYCSNESTEFTLQSSYTAYLWSNGAQTINTSVTGVLDQISVEVQDFNGCWGSDTLLLSPIDVPELNLGPDIHLCDTVSVVLNGTVPGASSYDWQPINSSAPVVDVLPGNYILTVSYDICTIVDSISIAVKPYTLDLGENQIICEDTSIFLIQSMVNIDSLIWSDGSQGGAYYQQTSYLWEDSVVISATAFGCDVQRDSVVIFFEDCNCQVFVPNSFTPNNDGFNELFKIEQDCPIEYFEFRLFNRWGEVIFETKDVNFTWDGRLKQGNSIQEGTYTWQMRYLNEHVVESDYKEKYGHVNVLR